MANFLDSVVIPGSQMEKRHHRRMVTLLVVAIIIAIAIIAVIWFGVGQEEETQTNVSNTNLSSLPPVLAELKKAEYKSTPQEKAAAFSEIKKAAVPTSSRNKAATMNELKALVK